MRESHFQNYVVREAMSNGWLVCHFRTARSQSGRYWTPVQGHVGFPDLVLVRDSCFCVVELKRDSGRLSVQQRRWLSLLSKHVQCVGVWRPHMIDSIRVFLETGNPSDFCGRYESGSEPLQGDDDDG